MKRLKKGVFAVLLAVSAAFITVSAASAACQNSSTQSVLIGSKYWSIITFSGCTAATYAKEKVLWLKQHNSATFVSELPVGWATLPDPTGANHPVTQFSQFQMTITKLPGTAGR